MRRSRSAETPPQASLRLRCRGWFAVALWLGFAALAVAQPAAPVTVRFTVFAAKPVSGLAFAPGGNAAPQPLTFYPTARSPRYEHRGPMPLRFVEAKTGNVVAEAHLPAGLTEALQPAPAAKKGDAPPLHYQIAVLDDSAARHAAGGLAIVNLSGLGLSGMIDKEAVTLNPGLNPTLRIGRTANITLRTTVKNRSYQSYTGTVNLGRNERALLLLFPPFYAGSVEVQSRLLLDQPPGAGR
jgi:hypothetical protein